MDSRADPDTAWSRIFCQGGGGGGGPGPTARIQDPHMGPIRTHARTHARARAHTHTHTHTHIHTYIHTYINMYRQTHEADGWTYMYMYRRQTKRQFIQNMHNNVQRQCQKQTFACMSRHTCASHYLKISHENEWFGPIEPNLFHFHRISKNGGHGGGSSEPHEAKLDPPLLIHAC